MRGWRQRWYVRRHEWNGWIRHFRTRTLNNEHLFWSSLYFVKIPTFLRHFLSSFFFIVRFLETDTFIRCCCCYYSWVSFRPFTISLIICWDSTQTRLHEKNPFDSCENNKCAIVCIRCTCKLLNWIFGHNLSACLKKKIAVSRSSSRLDQSMRIGRERERRKKALLKYIRKSFWRMHTN